MVKKLLSLCLLLSLSPVLRAADNGVAKTPPRGWSSWSFIRGHPTEENIEAQADALKKSGLVEHGFVYINIDDNYYLNPAKTVDQYGRWVIDPKAFPNGMGAMGKKIHDLGLKFGMYMTPGIPVAAYDQNTPIEGTQYHARDIVSDTTKFAVNYNLSFGPVKGRVMYHIDFTKPGAQEFLDSWAKLLASYGIDYLKLDGVGDNSIDDIKGWSKALRNCGRPVHFELSNSLDPKNGAIWREYTNGWRTEGDIDNYHAAGRTNWGLVLDRFFQAPKFTRWAGPGGWSDLDSVEVGNGKDTGLTLEEQRIVVTLWAITRSVFFLGVDLTKLQPDGLELLKNDEVLALSEKGNVATPLAYKTPIQIWRALEPDGTYAVALFNTGTNAQSVGIDWEQIGFNSTAAVYDLWSHKDMRTKTTGFTDEIGAHAVRLLRVTPDVPVRMYCATAVSGSATLQGSPVATNGMIAKNTGQGGTVTFDKVVVKSTGDYSITILYANAASNRKAEISINGAPPQTINFPTTGSGDALGGRALRVHLTGGMNSIVIGNASGSAPDIDSITVQAKE